ncbi:hypothetical protein [Vibrio owensii]|uniref:hypothetical protein n=1 Tax=Vibrio owensii TaxID=696485 RepID=UPI0018F24C85|nr:hypothetical protein [Vibrio owensii]
MKVKKKLVGQYILDELGDTENSDETIQDFLPIIGEIVVAFNGLEATLDSAVCEMFSDRSDQKGLYVLHSMMYSTKVDLFKKFSDDLMRNFELEIEYYKSLLSELKECGVLRNKVVHANWEYTDDDGYTQVKYKVGNDGLEHELCQFSVDSLSKIVEKIYDTRNKLSDFEVECIERTAEKMNSISS